MVARIRYDEVNYTDLSLDELSGLLGKFGIRSQSLLENLHMLGSEKKMKLESDEAYAKRQKLRQGTQAELEKIATEINKILAAKEVVKAKRKQNQVT